MNGYSHGNNVNLKNFETIWFDRLLTYSMFWGYFGEILGGKEDTT